jgi:hypothetical protein
MKKKMEKEKDYRLAPLLKQMTRPCLGVVLFRRRILCTNLDRQRIP